MRWRLFPACAISSCLSSPQKGCLRHHPSSLFHPLRFIRYSSQLFRLSDPKDVIRQLSFSNTGPGQVPGVIVMQIVSGDCIAGGGGGSGVADRSPGGVADPSFRRIIVVFNCSPLGQRVEAPLFPEAPAGGAAGGGPLQLHPLVSSFGHDERTRAGCRVDAEGGLVVAARTTAVFVEPR